MISSDLDFLLNSTPFWTISVAWKLKKLSNIFWQKIFFLLNPLSKGVAPLCIVLSIHSEHCLTSLTRLPRLTSTSSTISVATISACVQIQIECEFTTCFHGSLVPTTRLLLHPPLLNQISRYLDISRPRLDSTFLTHRQLTTENKWS